MQQNRLVSQKAFRGAAVLLLSALAFIIVISPSQAATIHEQMDRSAVALISIIAILLLAIIYNVWRMTSGGQIPFDEHTTNKMKSQRRHN